MVREDGCTTRLPLLPVSPVSTQRTLMSWRVSLDGGRAWLGGRGSRPFELEFLR